MFVRDLICVGMKLCRWLTIKKGSLAVHGRSRPLQVSEQRGKGEACSLTWERCYTVYRILSPRQQYLCKGHYVNKLLDTRNHMQPFSFSSCWEIWAFCAHFENWKVLRNLQPWSQGLGFFFSLFAIKQKGDEAFISVYCETKLQMQELVYSANNEWKFAYFVIRLVFSSPSTGL